MLSLLYKNFGFSVDHVTGEDTWAMTTGSQASAVAYLKDANNVGSLGRLAALRTAWAAPAGSNVNYAGVSIARYESQVHLAGPFDFTSTTVSFNGGLSTHRLGFGRKAPSALVTLPPGASDAATTQSLVNAIRAELIAKGLAL